jgi:ribonuclease G
LMDRYNKTIQVRPQSNYHREQYDLYGRSAHGEDHKVASSLSTLRAPDGAGLPPDRSEPPREPRQERGHRGRNRRGGRDRDRREGGGQQSPKPPPGPPADKPPPQP